MSFDDSKGKPIPSKLLREIKNCPECKSSPVLMIEASGRVGVCEVHWNELSDSDWGLVE